MTFTKLFFGTFFSSKLWLFEEASTSQSWAVSKIDTGELLNIYLYNYLS